MSSVNIKGLEWAKVLAALFNAAEIPRGIAAEQITHGPHVMDLNWAQGRFLISGPQTFREGRLGPTKRDVTFSRVYGRWMNVTLRSDGTFNPTHYDEANLETGRARRVIDTLRRTGDYRQLSTVPLDIWMARVIDNTLERYSAGDLPGAKAQFLIGMARHADSAWLAEDNMTHTRLTEVFDLNHIAVRDALCRLANLQCTNPTT
jgi:hypothetical protein